MDIEPPYWPPFGAKVEREIGRFIIAWNVMEGQIDDLIWDLLRVEMHTGAKITANLGIKGKLDLVHSLYEEFRAVESFYKIPTDADSRFDKLVNATADASGNTRNLIVHAHYVRIKFSRKERPMMMKLSSRKGGLKGVAVTPNAEYVGKAITQALDLAHQWHKMRLDLAFALHIATMSDADTPPAEKRGSEWLLHLQPQSSHDSPQAKPKLRSPRPQSEQG